MADENRPQKPGQMEIQIKADDKELAGSYTTIARINHSPEEFIMDFMYIIPDPPFGKLVSRLILSPGHAKRLLRALEENVRNYEAKFGEIQTQPVNADPKLGFLQ